MDLLENTFFFLPLLSKSSVSITSVLLSTTNMHVEKFYYKKKKKHVVREGLRSRYVAGAGLELAI